MIAIASLDDPRVTDYRAIAKPQALTEAGLFVAEGRLVVRRLLGLPRYVTRSVLVTPAARDALGDLLQRLDQRIPVYIVDQAVMNGVTGFNMHRGCLALAERPAMPLLDGLPGTARRLVILEGVNNPDNVGGVFRSAAALGVDAVVLGPGCADPFYRKAIRTSMGATLQVSCFDAGDWPTALTTLRHRGFHLIALTPAAHARPLSEVRPDHARVALVVGAEGGGLTAPAMAAADECVRIPMAGATDSLNVTVATSIALYGLRG